MFKIIISLLFVFFTFGCTAQEIDITKKTLDKRCLSKGETGHCRAYFKRYFFNQNTNRCEQFIWGGCGGNVPFNSMDKCQQICEKQSFIIQKGIK